MLTKTRFTVFTLMIAFVFLMSAIYAVPAYADGETPPVEPPVVTEPVEPPTQDSAAEESVPTPLDTAPAIEEIPSAGSVASVLAEIPQGTEVVVVNETGEAIPLATTEAAQAILEGDPMWCPAGITPGGAGCTTPTTSFATMLTNLTTLYGAVGPSKAGVIWIEGSYDSTVHDFGATSFTLTGSNLTDMKNFALTLQGGWTGAGKTIDTSNPSDFHVPLMIIGWEGDVTLSNITFSNTTTGGNALQVSTTRNIVLTNIISENNTGRGALLTNNSGTGNVTITNSKFNNNLGDTGLNVQSNGIITLKDVTTNFNVNGIGAVLLNNTAATPKAVTLSGTNTFSNNGTTIGNSGLYVVSKGPITLNNLIASNNGNAGFGQGAELYNNVGSTSGVTLTGTNIFADNQNNGLYINTLGAIKASNVYANSNGQTGVYLTNSVAATLQPVTFTGTNEFKYNTIFGLYIQSVGQITLNNVTANSNGQTGASLNNNLIPSSAGITLSGTNSFKTNGYSGLIIQSRGTVLINNISADGNGTSGFTGNGVSISNGSTASLQNVTITGFNSFSDNFVTGLSITSSGIITLNNITASNNGTVGFGGDGVSIANLQSGASVPKAVILNGTNAFNFNLEDGLEIMSYGEVTLNNVTANNNGAGGTTGYGVLISNQFSTNPQKVTVKGTNTFNDNFQTGLYISSKGAILTNALTATGNDEYGVYLLNGGGTATSTVTMTGTNVMTGNVLDNLFIQSASTITLGNITASFSTAGYGANISNNFAVAKAVTISGTNEFNSNGAMGLLIASNGAITLNNITASSNSSHGANLYNALSTTKASVTLNGVNTFNGNTGGGNGLQILSSGNVKTNAVTANSNGGYGVFIDITTGASPIGSVTMNGANNFNANGNTNLDVRAVGAIILNGINSTASVNGNGASITNTASGTASPKPVTLTGANIFSNNVNGNGLSISTHGVITTNNITASNNGVFGGYFINSSAVAPAGVNILGTNLFDTNTANGLYVETKGLIKTNNITANNSANGYGTSLNNNLPGTTAGITMTGINQFNNNNTSGLEVNTNGAITASNITASSTSNGLGASFNNLFSGFATPKAITLSGSNNFNSNRTSGLVIDTYGAVTINNLTANNNGLGLVSGMGADIDNYVNDATIASSITLTGNNTFIDNYQQGLRIESFGAIKVNNLKADANGSTTTQSGVELFSQNASSNAFGITLTGTNTFNNNGNLGLYILTKGAVLLNNMNASSNSNYGFYVDNTYAGTSGPKPVTLTGTNVFNNSITAGGFYIYTFGAVTASNVAASGNAGIGGSVSNNPATTPANVVFTGFNTFNDNDLNGLYINSKGTITLSNITANDNMFSGLDISNSVGSAGITLTGINTFNSNGDNGATIVSNGAVNLTKITGDENSQSGLVVSTTGSVTITCGSFNMNTWYGWEVPNTSSLLTLKGVFTAGNGLGDFVNNALSTVTVRNCP